ncbi:MAG TPA: hypothetical protein DCR14_20665 [Acidimicrobiaceae bacterium]|nr:hypothetical protein [Acidimicrobiaceae bacterium]
MDVEGLLGELRGVVDRLAAADVSVLDAAGLEGLVVGLQVEASRLAAASAVPLHVWEVEGVWRSSRARTAGLALANRVRRCHHVVAGELGRAAKLSGMPLVRAAVLEGRLSMDHVDLFCRYATEARWPLFQRDEAVLVEACVGLSLFADARKLVRYWADHVDDELGDTKRPVRSEVETSRSRDTGELTLRGHLSPVDAEVFCNELDRLVRDIRLEDQANGVDRPIAQQRAAALLRMAQRSNGATGTSGRPLFQVIIGDATVARLCELASGHVITPEELVPHLGTALVESFLFDERHRLVGVSKQRTFTGRLRRAIQIRDRRCQHESGCPVPATDLRSDIDHIVPWAQGGVTGPGNGRVLCTTHNRHQHLHGPPLPALSPSAEGPPDVPATIRWRWVHVHYHDIDPTAA